MASNRKATKRPRSPTPSSMPAVFEPLEELVLNFEQTDVLSAATWAKLREAHHHFALRVTEVAIEHGAAMTRVDMREKPLGVVAIEPGSDAFVVGHALSELTRDVLGERDGDEGAVYDEACRDRVAEAVLEPTHEVAFRVGLVELPANHWLARDAALLGRAAAYVRASLGVRIVAVDIAAALASDVALRAQLALRGTVLWRSGTGDGRPANSILGSMPDTPAHLACSRRFPGALRERCRSCAPNREFRRRVYAVAALTAPTVGPWRHRV